MSEKRVKKIIKTIINYGEPISLSLIISAIKEPSTKVTIVVEELEKAGYLICKDGKYWPSNYYKGYLFYDEKRNLHYLEINNDIIYINKSDLKEAVTGDYVIIKGLDFKSSRGRVVSIKENNLGGKLGTVRTDRGKIVIVSSDEIIVNPKNPKHFNLANGHLVIVKNNTIVAINGHILTPTGSIRDIMEKHGLDMKFPNDVLAEAQKIKQEVTPSDLKGRLDLRNLLTFTIDGDKTTDFDDAVSLTMMDNGHYLLGVHIAHVSYYVKEDSLIAQEAIKRAFSNYSEGKCIPMLPWELTSGICSLSEGVDRLTKSYFMEFDEKGELVNYKILNSVINSNKRMTYSKVSAMLSDEEYYDDYEEYMPQLRDMKKLSSLIRQKREQKSLQFDFSTSEFIFSPKGDVLDVISRKKMIAENIIEDFMLMTNLVDTTDKNKRNQLCIYRNHDYPKAENIDYFIELLRNDNIELCNNKKINWHLFMKKLQDPQKRRIYSMILLFCMEKANYSTTNIGHYALGFDATSHVTSPIRRCPDLLQQYISDNNYRVNDNKASSYEQMSKCFSKQEVKYQQLEREMYRFYCSKYMLDKVGQEFRGEIVDISSRGIYINIYNGIIGFLNTTHLENTSVNRRKMIFINHGNVYKLGDTLDVVVKDVSSVNFSISLEISKQKIKQQIK
ncbi:MAG: RNB domain-containing ribonuclease [Bacilli bacterium]|nr:RNB domain-containing ribonuclease [Bacilli bacterium]